MTTPFTIAFDVHFRRPGRGAPKEVHSGPATEPAAIRTGRLPRVARLMALAIRFDGLVCTGQVKNHAELARLGRVSRARISQIMSLLFLAPDIQEDLLFLPAIESRRTPILLCQSGRSRRTRTGPANDGSGINSVAWRVAAAAPQAPGQHPADLLRHLDEVGLQSPARPHVAASSR